MRLKQLRIATFNLYNLNQPGMPIYTGKGWTEEQYDLKIGWTGALAHAGAVGRPRGVGTF